MRAWRKRQVAWLALAGLLVLAFVAVPFAPSNAHAVAQANVPYLHQDQAPAATPRVSTGAAQQQPCDEHHCMHGPFCCMSGCLGGGLAVAPEVLPLALSLDLARFLLLPPTRPNGFEVRPALPPPRAIV